MRYDPLWSRHTARILAAASVLLASASASAAPIVVGGHAFPGRFDAAVTPADATGAIGTTRYIQLTSSRYAIYNRSTHAVISAGTLDNFAGYADSAESFDPQIIWDATTSRFYYAMVGKDLDDRAFRTWGFSKTASPNSIEDADWCRYILGENPGSTLNYSRLGDTQHFFLIGTYTTAEGTSFRQSHLYAFKKPPSGTTCPPGSSLGAGGAQLKDPDTQQYILAPVPANQIDTSPTGYVIGRSSVAPSTTLWLFTVTRNPATGDAVVSFNGRPLTVPSYDVPPDATQNTFTQKIDTLDARLPQAVLARNPTRANSPFSLWTQHTVRNGSLSAIRWYEINPAPEPPVVLRTGLITAPGRFYYNGAISPDRRVDGTIRAFGGSFVIGYNVSSAANGIWPRIGMASSVNGGPLSSVTVFSAAGPYRDKSCPNAGQVCAWGKQAGAAPDPRPETTGTGAVWLTTQFAGSTNTSTAQANWRTRIWAAKP